jgi:hypothetical protein
MIPPGARHVTRLKGYCLVGDGWRHIAGGPVDEKCGTSTNMNTSTHTGARTSTSKGAGAHVEGEVMCVLKAFT